jgi:hypothetical protein
MCGRFTRNYTWQQIQALYRPTLTTAQPIPLTPLLAERCEAIPVGVNRIEARHLDVNRVCPLAPRFRRTVADDCAHGVVGGHLPRHEHRLRHATKAIRRKRLRRKPRPKHEPVRGRLPRGDAELERIIGGNRTHSLAIGNAFASPVRGRSALSVSHASKR